MSALRSLTIRLDCSYYKIRHHFEQCVRSCQSHNFAEFVADVGLCDSYMFRHPTEGRMLIIRVVFAPSPVHMRRNPLGYREHVKEVRYVFDAELCRMPSESKSGPGITGSDVSYRYSTLYPGPLHCIQPEEVVPSTGSLCGRSQVATAVRSGQAPARFPRNVPACRELQVNSATSPHLASQRGKTFLLPARQKTGLVCTLFSFTVFIQ